MGPIVHQMQFSVCHSKLADLLKHTVGKTAEKNYKIYLLLNYYQ